ncbi:heparinase II/III family protein [Coraliomargarita parva]|uniref:heparinase II/III family protein n=1 Tax=Coraliomargarita parva TaxID=3014050 RepID=UPI0022B58AEC|nr:heparinase II/III family protein [Coraliomargarita parva]
MYSKPGMNKYTVSAFLALLMVLFVGACQRQSSNQTESSVPPAKTREGLDLAPSADESIEFIAALTPEPALGDETPVKPDSSHRELPPPPLPTRERIDELAAIVTAQPVGVGVPAGNREVWDRLAAQPQAGGLIKNAEQALLEPIVPITLELWQLYATNGDRKVYQDTVCSRYNRLRDLAIGEAIEYKGRFIPAIEETLTEILEQGAWSVPAHGKDIAIFNGERTVVDLAAAQLSWTLATVDYWLAESLSPDLRTQLKSEIERRVLEPYITAIRSGHPIWWMIRPNNWTAVCTGAITGAALTLEEDPTRRAEFVADAEQLLARYIDSFSDEGISEEGIGYWSFGFSHFLYASEAIRRTSNGAVDLMDNAKVFRISQSPVSLEVADGIYGAFGDQAIYDKPQKQICTFAARRYGLNTDDSQRFDQVGKGASHPLSPQLYSWIIRTFGGDAPLVSGFEVDANLLDEMDYRSWFSESQLYICRPGPGEKDAMSVAIRAGNNGESHNHNDIGSYTVVYKGIPVLVDPGMERYTSKSFSAGRYEASLNNSYGHPVPLVANRMQKVGVEGHGEVLDAEATNVADTVLVDLTRAYRSPELEKLTRSLHYLRPDGANAGSISLADHVEFNQAETFSTALITRGTFKVINATTLRVTDRGVSLYVKIDTGGKPFALSEDVVTGFAKPNRPLAQRLGIVLLEPVKNAVIDITISPTLSGIN